MIGPFKTSRELAIWTATVIEAARVDQLVQWRMLEYWVQVELYRAVQTGRAGTWRHLGEFEQPYFTRRPRPGTKLRWKWADLVVAEPELKHPKRVVWLELKDLGRNPKRVQANARNAGVDLAALAALDPQKSADGWEQPPQHIVDEGRLPEWSEYADGLRHAKHLIAQIVLLAKKLLKDGVEVSVMTSWRQGFNQRAEVKADMQIGRAETRAMVVLATVWELGSTQDFT